MAKKEGTPALTAERVWKAISRRSLVVEPVPGTRMLKVVRGRVRLTWSEKGEKNHTRIRLSRIYLNPRWIPLPANYPAGRLKGLDNKGLAAKGIVRFADGSYRLLIYQQLGDLFTLLRQIEEHIFPQYSKEEDKLWELFGKIDLREALGLTSAPLELQESVLARVAQITTIKTHLAGRAQATESRISVLRRLRKHIRGALAMYLKLIPSSGEEKGAVGAAKGISEAIKRLTDRLPLFGEEKPLAHGARWAGYHLLKASGDLLAGQFKRARAHVQEASDYLKWPEGEPSS